MLVVCPLHDETHGGMDASSFISLFIHSAGRLMEQADKEERI